MSFRGDSGLKLVGERVIPRENTQTVIQRSRGVGGDTQCLRLPWVPQRQGEVHSAFYAVFLTQLSLQSVSGLLYKNQ